MPIFIGEIIPNFSELYLLADSIHFSCTFLWEGARVRYIAAWKLDSWPAIQWQGWLVSRAVLVNLGSEASSDKC